MADDILNTNETTNWDEDLPFLNAVENFYDNDSTFFDVDEVSISNESFIEDENDLSTFDVNDVSIR